MRSCTRPACSRPSALGYKRIGSPLPYRRRGRHGKGRTKEARVVASSRAAGMVTTAAPGASKVAGSARPRQVSRTRNRSRARESRGDGSGPSLASGTAAAATETGPLELHDLQLLAQSTGLTLARVGPTTPTLASRLGLVRASSSGPHAAIWRPTTHHRLSHRLRPCLLDQPVEEVMDQTLTERCEPLW